MLTLETDVLVIGGGMAAAWSAIAAAREGASVTLVDKGHAGTSGVTATAPCDQNRRWLPHGRGSRRATLRHGILQPLHHRPRLLDDGARHVLRLRHLLWRQKKPLDLPKQAGRNRALARAMLEGPVYCDLSLMPKDMRLQGADADWCIGLPLGGLCCAHVSVL